MTYLHEIRSGLPGSLAKTSERFRLFYPVQGGLPSALTSSVQGEVDFLQGVILDVIFKVVIDMKSSVIVVRLGLFL